MAVRMLRMAVKYGQREMRQMEVGIQISGSLSPSTLLRLGSFSLGWIHSQARKKGAESIFL